MLAGAEEQRVVPEVDVVRPAGRGQPGNGGLARLTPLERLARVQRRGSRPSPGDLGREQGGNGERQHGRGALSGPIRKAQEAGSDGDREERQREDQVPGLRRACAPADPGQGEADQRDGEDEQAEREGERTAPKEGDEADDRERGHGREQRRPSGDEVAEH